ncbi:adhesion G protein-coupled receptor B1-like [Antedon mediterranea]|uniref:adhesion G protein-coupled receptor B1-like n=1 Tax=Antedon mediterranea TaxID=105859 RepID=UPI003AF4BAB6
MFCKMAVGRSKSNVVHIFMYFIGFSLFLTVIGELDVWSEWSTCSKTCSVGIRSRSRNSCGDNVVYNETTTCLEIEQEDCEEVQNCPVNGDWGDWQPYSACSATCGTDAFRSRDRVCDNPPAQYGGESCYGESRSTRNCGFEPCPIDGGWGEWSSWTGCSKTCGTGKSVRKRSCNNPKPKYNGLSCNGESTGKRTCTMDPCFKIRDWTEWSKWSHCSDCVMYSKQRRTRQCPIPEDGKSFKCDGLAIEYHKCESEADCIIEESDKEELENEESSGDGCVGNDCCDDDDADCSPPSYSSSLDKTTTQPPTKKCKRYSTPEPGIDTPESGNESPGDVLSYSESSEGSVSLSDSESTPQLSYEWVECKEEEEEEEIDEEEEKTGSSSLDEYYD